MSGPLEPVQVRGPGPRRAAVAVVAAAALVAAAAWAGSGFPVDPRAPLPTRPRPVTASPSSLAPAIVPASCPAASAGLPTVRVTRPAAGSIWSTEGPLGISGSGAPQTGTLTADLDASTGTLIRRIAADGSFAADMLVYPATGPARSRLTLSWAPDGVPDACARSVATVDFFLASAVPVSIWLLGGPPRRIPGPPYSLTVAALPGVVSVSATLAPAGGGPPVAAAVEPGQIIAKRARPFQLVFPDSLPRGPALLTMRWASGPPASVPIGASSAPRAGPALRLPVVVVEPEIEGP
ncbi:MAG: hypothetical protein ACRDGL_04840 [Candidatus Limnocylindrales bacterium]